MEVVNGLVSVIKVNDFAFSHEQQFIEHIKDVGVRLMDGGDHSLTLLDSQLAQVFHDLSSNERVEASGGLIQEDQRGIRDKLNTHRSTFALSSRNTLHKRSTDVSVLSFVKLELFDQSVNTSDF